MALGFSVGMVRAALNEQDSPRMFGAIWLALGDLKPGQAVMLTGFVGFLTLACGHVLNAWLTRRRDAKLDSLQRKRAVQAFAAELTVVQTQFELAKITINSALDKNENWVSLPKCRSYTPFRTDLVKNLSLLNDKQIIVAANIYAHFDYVDAMVSNFGDKEHPIDIDDVGSSVRLNLSAYGISKLLDMVNINIEQIAECREKFLAFDIFHSDRERELYAAVIKDVMIEVTKRVAKKG